MSELLDSLQEFRSRFVTFKANRLRVHEIYRETREAWLRWKLPTNVMHARSLQDSSKPELQSTADKENAHHDPAVSSKDCSLSFEDEMSVVVSLLQNKPTLVFVGQLKSGKSTLANIILQHHVLPTDEGPCTARMVKLKPIRGSNPYLQVLKASGTRLGKPITLERVVDSEGLCRLIIPPNVVDVGREISSSEERSKQFRDEKGQETEHGAWVEIFYPHPLFEFIEIVDSPGKGENESLDQLVNETICNGLVQTLVYVIDGCRGLTVRDRIDIRSIKNQMTEDSKGKGKICFVCTRLDEALQEDEYEPPPTYLLDELSSDSEDDGPAIDSGHPDDSDTVRSIKPDLRDSTLQYSTRIHERVFNDLVDEGFLNDLEEDQLQSHDLCDYFHCVSAHAAAHFSRGKDDAGENLFLRDFIQLERSLAKVIVEDLNAHVKDALEELISKQILLIETMFKTKFSLARKGVVAEQRLLFTVQAEERVYKELRRFLGTSHNPQLQKIIKQEKAACLEFLPQEAGSVNVLVDATVGKRKDQDTTAATQIREYVCKKLNDKFKRRVQDHLPVLNVTEIIKRSAETMQKQVRGSLEAVRTVSAIMQVAYRPLSNALVVKKGLPLKLRIKSFWSAILGREPSESYTKAWKEDVARHFLESLDAKSLTEEYCADVQQTLDRSHEKFKLSIGELEAATQSIVEKARSEQLQIRIKDGYELAALFLNSKSILDSLRYGVPQKGNMICAGPTGTVHECLEGSWGQRANVVVKVRKPWPPPVSREVWPASLYFSIECIDHENIQKAIGFLVPPEAATNEIWILEESCLCNLEDVIQGTIQLDNIPWLQVGKNVVDGLFHLFCQGIPHHNIKPTNVLLSDRCEAKLSDMGMYDIVRMKEQKITRAVYFVAPEMATSETQGVATSDVYSVAILLWYLFKGYSEVKKSGQAVPDPSNFGICETNPPASVFFEMVCNPSVPLRPELDEWSSPDHILSKAASLMQRCWHLDSSERLDCARLKEQFYKVTDELQRTSSR